MSKEREAKKKHAKDSPYQVYGLHILVHVQKETPKDLELHCPKGDNVVYGKVLTSGDGFDADAADFRPMPDVGTIVAFEESAEDVQGHYFYRDGEEYRVIHLDSVILSFPPSA